ncbi:hypothetical protein CA85_23550 [Allorhodopirellula solitaria]|uniref:Uncharacterized protein n=1 Tax=Allorhodopirellula solitaria TaxID=2527987 RepID=A0A5C5XX97_9BACT|nr:hypothetical protein CA85_23550 [Allorhodopirellula solitaria]
MAAMPLVCLAAKWISIHAIELLTLGMAAIVILNGSSDGSERPRFSRHGSSIQGFICGM